MVEFKEGMLIFQPLPKVGLGEVIADATGSDISHVGILHKNEAGQWVVIESIGKPGYAPPVDEFLRRSGGVAWYREITSLQPEKVPKFIHQAQALSQRDYDFYFVMDNDRYYCSELVLLAAAYVGITGPIEVITKTSWLDRTKRSVQTYLKTYHPEIKPGDPLPELWSILSPNMLFYSNQLKDPTDITDFRNNRPPADVDDIVPDNAIYDTLPGSTGDEKFAAFLKKWQPFVKQLAFAHIAGSSGKSYLFKVNLGDRQLSLILVGAYPEEEAFAQRIIKYIYSAH
jgi:hypothetical protein